MCLLPTVLLPAALKLLSVLGNEVIKSNNYRRRNAALEKLHPCYISHKDVAPTLESQGAFPPASKHFLTVQRPKHRGGISGRCTQALSLLHMGGGERLAAMRSWARRSLSPGLRAVACVFHTYLVHVYPPMMEMSLTSLS